MEADRATIRSGWLLFYLVSEKAFEVKSSGIAFFFDFRLVFPENGNILTDALPP